jgi:gliding motility-associated protein GldL
MSISELVESEGYKKFMAKVYGFGASIVLVGALFKIQHYPGASIMLIIGLLVEALIFFFSAFEPPHEDIDWTLVYPELAGLDEIEETIIPESKQSKGKTAIERFDELLQNAEAGPGLFDKLGKGLNNLSTTVSNMSDITNATVATETYAKSVKGAASSVDSLSASFSKSADAINSTANVVATSGQSYQTLLEGLNSSFSSIGTNSKAQSQQQELLTKNLSALNAVYELQLKNSSNNLENTEKVTSGINNIMNDLKSTADDVAKYKNEISKLSTNLQALNTVYGNMLSAMNVK